MDDAPATPNPPSPSPPPSNDSALRPGRFIAWALLAIGGFVAIAIVGVLTLASDPDATPPSAATPNPTASTAATTPTTGPGSPTQPPSPVAPTPSSPPAPSATAPAIGATIAPTPTAAGNRELDGTIVDALRASAGISQPPPFAGDAVIVALIDGLPEDVGSGLIQRFDQDDEFSYVIRYYLLPNNSSARDLARNEAGVPTQFEGATTIDDRDVPDGACVTVVVLEEAISRCYVLRGRVAAIIEILGPAAARDHILDAGVALAGYSRELLVRAIDD